MTDPLKQPETSCCSNPKPQHAAGNTENKPWNKRYFLLAALIGIGWWLIYSWILPASHWLVFDFLEFTPGSHAGSSLEFFIYDTVKILMLLAALIYVIAWLRASLQIDKVRTYLSQKQRGVGYFLGASFGAITPFCSCSSIPLFLGFTTAGIPMGISMSFLITSPLINEIAIVLLWGLLGWKFTVAYIAAGMLAGMAGGWFMDKIKANRWLQPYILEKINTVPTSQIESSSGDRVKLSIRQRHDFAYNEMSSIFKRVWKWVLVGVGIGALLHGYVPENWFAENFSANEWWTVPAAVFAAIPLYSNVTGIIPVMESLLLKGLPIGTTMAFCMSAVVASIPEFIMLRQIMTFRLQLIFLAYLWVILNIVGWGFNTIGPYIL